MQLEDCARLIMTKNVHIRIFRCTAVPNDAIDTPPHQVYEGHLPGEKSSLVILRVLFWGSQVNIM